ncbi:MAG: 3-deoxy-manno-octulosonate cytidylyltransferase [Alphaproteobacteria bacterium]
MTRPFGSALVVIPARLASTRLPGKPLADIAGEPMIVHVWRRAVEAGVGPVVVACGDAPIAEAVRRAGGTAVMTPSDLPSGSDRIHCALEIIDPDRKHGAVINLQGDQPMIRSHLLTTVLDTLNWGDISTLARPIRPEEPADDPNVVKVAAAWPAGGGPGRALYFSRSAIPWGEGELLHHIGLYAYRRAALARFVALPPSPLERRERLEQLRALEAGMTIAVARVDTVPLGVDTPADLERARALLAARPPVTPR